MRLLSLKIVFLCLAISGILFSQEAPPINSDALPKPAKPIQPVYDYGELFTPLERQRLKQELINYEDSTSTEIVLITVKTLNGKPIHRVAAETGDFWEIGKANEDNGIVILVSVDERKIDMRVGYGAQTGLPTAVSKTIIDNIMQPYFQRQEYFEGTQLALRAIYDNLSGKFDGDPKKPENYFPLDNIIIGLLILFFIINLIRRIGGRGGGRGPGGVIFTDFGRSSWGGGFGGGGGGGFGGFGGGGGFSGGGASGGW